MNIRFQTMLDELSKISLQFPDKTRTSMTKYESEQYAKCYDHFNCASIVNNITSTADKVFGSLHKHAKKETQTTSSVCEDFVMDAVIGSGFTLLESLPEDAKVSKRTGKQFLRQQIIEEQLIIDISFVSNLFETFEPGVKYAVQQPFGPNFYPDILLIEKVVDTINDVDMLYLFALEVKQGKTCPIWNNNPPKAGFGYVFFCSNDQKAYYASGKEIRGANIMTDDVMKYVHTEFCRLCEKHLYDKDSNTKIISYKKIEVTSFPK